MIEQIKSLILKYAQIIKYIISGGTAAFVDILFLYVFTDIFHWWYLASAVVAFLIAFGFSFTMQKYWTFKDRVTENVHVQVSIFLGVSIANLAWNTLLMYFFVDIVHIWYIASQVLAGGIVALTSYFIYKKYIFKQN